MIYYCIGPQLVAPELNVAELYEPCGVLTSVEWTPKMNLLYNVSTFPEVSLVNTGETSTQLMIPYDTQIMVNVSAMLCGEIEVTPKNFFYASTSTMYSITEGMLL